MDALDLDPPRRQFLDILAEAHSNIRSLGNGADIFLRAIASAAHPSSPRESVGSVK